MIKIKPITEETLKSKVELAQVFDAMMELGEWFYKLHNDEKRDEIMTQLKELMPNYEFNFPDCAAEQYGFNMGIKNIMRIMNLPIKEKWL